MLYLRNWKQSKYNALFAPIRSLGLAQLGALHKHLHPPAQLRLRLDQGRTATAQGAVPLLNLYLRPLTFCSVELSPVSGPCCLLDSHALAFFTNSVNFT